MGGGGGGIEGGGGGGVVRGGSVLHSWFIQVECGCVTSEAVSRCPCLFIQVELVSRAKQCHDVHVCSYK